MDLEITEGVAGYHHYHFSIKGKRGKGLCGAPTMATSFLLHEWKIPFGEHFPKRPTWCEKCDRTAREQAS